MTHSMTGARALLISITGGDGLTLYDVDEAASRIRQEVDDEANIILGATFEPALEEASAGVGRRDGYRSSGQSPDRWYVRSEPDPKGCCVPASCMTLGTSNHKDDSECGSEP